MILHFFVHEQTVTALETTSVPRYGSKGYLRLAFEFDESWDAFPATNGGRTVYLQKGEISAPVVLDESGCVEVDDYFTATGDGFMLMLVGVNGTVVCPTNVLSVSLDPSGEAWTTEPPDLDIPAYQQLVMLAQQAVAAAEMAEAFVVNMLKNADGTYTADKTFAELKAAHAAGRTVICSFNDLTQQWDGPVRLPLVYLSSTGMGFAAVVEPEQDYMAYVWAYINIRGMGYAATEIATNDGSLVHYTAENKTDAQKTQARANIGAEAAPVELTWNRETYPDLLSFLRSISDVGRYTFSDDDYKYSYILEKADSADTGTEFYGTLKCFSASEEMIESTTFAGASVDALQERSEFDPVTHGYLDSRIPKPIAADAGKVLTVDASGYPAWTAVINAEEVAV